jgi:hypothetical protein
MSEPLTKGAAPRTLATRFQALLMHERLALVLALAATLLTLPALWLGSHLDDHVHRYMFSGLPGSAELLHAYQSPYGIANGDPATNHWQVEAGYAPWWIHPQLLISLFRPLSAWTHQLDAWLWPTSALFAHAHSLLWHFALVFAATRLYRSVLGTTSVAGLAAVLFAFDHCHGFAVGWIANRNAVIAAFFGVLALHCHQRGRVGARRTLLWLAPPLLGAALLSGEIAVAVFGYLIGYALFLDPGTRRSRMLSLVPHVVMLVLWRVAYQSLDRGARFSGLYIDPAHEPLKFLAAMLQRLPVLVLGQFGLPPAEAYVFAPPALAQLLWLFALSVTLWLLIALVPLLIADRTARFWALGTACALAIACGTHPNNRLLYFVGLGAMPLLSQLWHGLIQDAPWLRASAWWRRSARGVAALGVGFHLLLSPLLLPLSVCSIALTAPTETAAMSLVEAGAGRDVVVVSSPDYFHTKLAPVLAALSGREPPRRLRVLSFGAVPLKLTRGDERTLDVAFEGGLLDSPLLELYRARDAVMPKGTRVQLHGLDIEVTELTADGRIAAARFRFDAALEDRRFAVLNWDGAAFSPFALPHVGQQVDVPAARLRQGL